MTDCKDIVNSVAGRIAYLRQALGLTQDEFAKKMGYSASYVCRMEHGLIDCMKNSSYSQDRSDAHDETCGKFLTKVYETYGVDLKWLIGESEKLPKEICTAQKAADEANAQSLARGERLKELRTDNNLTVRQFADIMNASTNTVVNTEKGHREITRQYAKRIEDTFDVSVDWILYGDEISRNYPFTDKMAEYMKKHEEVRKYVWDRMMEEEEDLVGGEEMSLPAGD